MTNSPMRAFLQKNVEGPRLRAMASKTRYPVCLELGCGNGRGVRIIMKLFGAEKVTATDIDPAQLDRAKNRLGPFGDKVEFRLESAMDLALEPDGTYDAVFAFGVIHHAEDWRKAIREICRVLKPGGEYFFDELLKGFLQSPPVRAATRHPEGGMFTAEEFTGHLSRTGFRVADRWKWDGIWLLGSAIKEAAGCGTTRCGRNERKDEGR